MNRRVIIATVAIASLILAGVAFDQQRTKEGQRIAKKAAAAEKKFSPLPQHGALLIAADDTEVSGTAKCGFCYWHEGGSSCNTVLEMTEEPGIVFLLPNERREEMERLTGKCAGGKYRVTARGAVTQYDGHNYMLVKNFDAVRTN